MLDFDHEKVMRTTCPQCGAPPGERCRTRSGKRYTGGDFHIRRKGLVYPRFLRDEAGNPKRGISKERRA